MADEKKTCPHRKQEERDAFPQHSVVNLYCNLHRHACPPALDGIPREREFKFNNNNKSI